MTNITNDRNQTTGIQKKNLMIYCVYGFLILILILVAGLENFILLPSALINILGLPLAAFGTYRMVSSHKNMQKVASSIVVLFEAIMMLGINIGYYTIPNPFFDFKGYLLTWCGPWSFLTGITFTLLIIYTSRCLRWTQEQYDELCRIKQTSKTEIQKARHDIRSEKVQSKKNREKENLDFRKREQQTRQEHEQKLAKLKYEGEEKIANQKWEMKIKQLPDSDVGIKEILAQKLTKFVKFLFQRVLSFGTIHNIISLMLALGLLCFFIYLPVFLGTAVKTNHAASNSCSVELWAKDVRMIMEVLDLETMPPSSGECGTSLKNTMEVVGRYVLIFITGVGILLAAVILLQRLFFSLLKNLFPEHKTKKYNMDNGGFIDQFAAPICVLLLGTAVLFSFVGNSTGDALVEIWKELLTVILFILILMVSIEVIRLALDQCIRKQSLLRKCIRYVYILIIDLLMQIVVGTITNFRIGDIMSALAGQKSEEDTSLHHVIKKYIKNALECEADEFSGNSKTNSEFMSFEGTEENVRRR